MLEQHVVPVRVEEHLDVLPPEAHSMPVNLYHTDWYLVTHAGLPRCLPDRVQVFVAPGKMLIQAERHPGELIGDERIYLLAELPDGAVGRVLDCRKGSGRTLPPRPTSPMAYSPSPFPPRRGPNICVRCTLTSGSMGLHVAISATLANGDVRIK